MQRILKVALGGLAFAVGFVASYAGTAPRRMTSVEPPKPSGAPSAPPFAPSDVAGSLDANAPTGDAEAGTPAADRTGAGYIDRAGHWAIAAQFSKARAFKEGVACVEVDGQWGFVDPQGGTVVPASYTEAGDFSDGMAFVREMDHKAGYIDRFGKLVIDRVYDEAWPFRNGVAIVGAGPEGQRQYRLIRKTGENVARLGWTPIGNFSEGFASLRVSDELIGFFDPTGRVVVKVRLDAVRDFHGGMAVVVLHGKTGAMNREWRVVIAPAFEAMTDFSENLAGAVVDSRHGFVDKKARFVIEAKYDDARAFSEGLAAVKRDGRYGYIDHSGREVIEPKFEDAAAFAQGLAAARVAGKWGYIDPEGKWVIEPQFAQAGVFTDVGLAAVSMGGEVADR